MNNQEVIAAMDVKIGDRIIISTPGEARTVVGIREQGAKSEGRYFELDNGHGMTYGIYSHALVDRSDPPVPTHVPVPTDLLERLVSYVEVLVPLRLPADYSEAEIEADIAAARELLP